MKTYRTYLFDFDYTLADSSKGIVTCFRHVLNRHGFSSVDDYTIKRTIGKTLEESFSILTGETSPSVLASFKAEYVKEADTYMTVNTFLFPETANVLVGLKERGAQIGVISTKYRFRIMELLGQKLPQGLLDVVVGGEDVTQPKPDPQGLLLGMERLGADKDTTLYIGDSLVDAETARRAGVDFLAVLHGMTTREEFIPFPHVGISPDLSILIE